MWSRLRYTFDDSHADKDYGAEWLPVHGHGCPPWLRHLLGFPARAVCRWRGHPAGVWFSNPNAMEPDMRCRGCGEDLG